MAMQALEDLGPLEAQDFFAPSKLWVFRGIQGVFLPLDWEAEDQEQGHEYWNKCNTLFLAKI